jgi:hypothetical protein
MSRQSGSPGNGNGFFLGGFGQFGDNAHSARLATVAAGANIVTLLTPTRASLFRVGNWVLITGLDMMGYGYPTNAAFFEYVQITAINPNTGAITFATPLRNGYKSTWPLYNAGNAFQTDQGGPATFFALDPSWNTQVEYRGLTISHAGQTYANGLPGCNLHWRGERRAHPEHAVAGDQYGHVRLQHGGR